MADWILTWWPVLSFVLGGILAGLGMWISWSAGKKFVTHDQWDAWRKNHAAEHDRLDDDLALGAQEFAAIKAKLEHLPTHDDMEPITRQLGGLASTLSGLAEAVGGIKTTLSGVNETIQTLLNHELAEARQVKAAAARKE